MSSEHRILAHEGIRGVVVGLVACLAALAAGLSVPQILALFVLTSGLAVVAQADAREMFIPDVISLPLVPLGLLASGRLVHPGATDLVPLNHLSGAILAPLILYLVGIAYRAIRKRPGVGLGDVKLMAVAGAWIGIDRVPLMLLIASTAGLLSAVFAHARTGSGANFLGARVPFGVYLALGIWVVWVLQQYSS